MTDRATIKAMPEWRRPVGSQEFCDDNASRERAGLEDVLLESMPGALSELLESACDAWNASTTEAQVRAALGRLERDGAARRDGEKWVRRG